MRSRFPLTLVAVIAAAVGIPACSSSESTTSPTTSTTVTPTTEASAPVKGTPAFVGQASCSDSSGDVRFPNDSADLVAVDLTAQGDSLVIAFKTAADPTAQPEGIEWRVEVFEQVPETDMRYTHFFIVSHEGNSFKAEAKEQGAGAAGDTTGTASVEGGRLVARFPFSQIADTELPTLAPPFKWAALTSGQQIDGDYCPDRKTALADSDEVTPFPN